MATNKEEKAPISDGLYRHHNCAFACSTIDFCYSCR